MTKKVWATLGGLLIGVFIALLVGFIFSPVVREIGGLYVGGITVLGAWLTAGFLILRYWKDLGANIMGAIIFGIGVAFITSLFVRPDFALMIVPPGTWIGMGVILTLTMYGAIQLIKK